MTDSPTYATYEYGYRYDSGLLFGDNRTFTISNHMSFDGASVAPGQIVSVLDDNFSPLDPGDTYTYEGYVEQDGQALPVVDVTDGFSESASTYVLGGTAGLNEAPIHFEDFPACYLRGTRILTPRGEVAIESLAIDDLVVTASGVHRAIKWIGRRSYAARFAGDGVKPVRIAAGALGDDLPVRDLFVSPRHAMLLDGVLIEARWLINGTTITQPQSGDDIHYFHIELDSHDCVIAEGAASETFLAIPDRCRFDNAAEFDALYPGQHALPKPSFAPRVQDGFAFQAVRDRLMPRRAA